MNIHVPHIEKQDFNYVKLQVPSKSKPGLTHALHFYPSGRHHCKCKGHGWAVKTRKYAQKCRHWKMSTIQDRNFAKPLSYLEYSLKLMRDPTKWISVSWGFISCQFPMYRRPAGVKCSGCPMYPAFCNKHPIYYGPRKNSKPLIWKIQTAVYNKRRGDAVRLMKKYIKEVKRCRIKLSNSSPR